MLNILFDLLREYQRGLEAIANACKQHEVGIVVACDPVEIVSSDHRADAHFEK